MAAQPLAVPPPHALQSATRTPDSAHAPPPPRRFGNFKEAIEFSVVVLVASIPLALEIVVTTTLALGSRELAKDGAIVTRLAAIEDLSGMNILCSDKTGTLTLNKMVIQKDTPTFLPGLDQAKVRLQHGRCPRPAPLLPR